MKSSLTVTTMHVFGNLPSAIDAARSAGSRLRAAVPLTRKDFDEPRDKEKQPDLVVGEQACHAIETIVSRTVRNDQGALVEHTDKSRGVPSWTDFDSNVRIVRSDHHDRSALDEKLAGTIDLFEDGKKTWRAIMFPQIALVGHRK